MSRVLGRTIRGAPIKLLVMMVRLYQGSLARFLGGQCRFHPSCSSYFIQALETRGALRGTLMGIWRILRCNPLAKGGYDPVK